MSLDKLAVRTTRGHVQRRLNGVVTALSNDRPGAFISIKLKRVHDVGIGVINRTITPKACALSSLTALFGTLCTTKKMGSVKSLEGVGMCQGDGRVTDLSMCSCLLGNGCRAGVHLRSGSVVVVNPCRRLIATNNGIGESHACRLQQKRALTSLLSVTNNFAKSTCANDVQIGHGTNSHCGVTAIGRRRFRAFILRSNSSLVISSIVPCCSGQVVVSNTI